MLTTLLPPTAGRATVAGFDIVAQGADVRRNIGAALQDTALDNFLTGREHMDLQGGLNGLRQGRPREPRARSCSSASGSPRRRTARSAAIRAA